MRGRQSASDALCVRLHRDSEQILHHTCVLLRFENLHELWLYYEHSGYGRPAVLTSLPSSVTPQLPELAISQRHLCWGHFWSWQLGSLWEVYKIQPRHSAKNCIARSLYGFAWLTSVESRVQTSAGLTSSIRGRNVEVFSNRQINDTSTSSNCRIRSLCVRSSLGEAHHRVEFTGHQQRRHSSFTRTACRSLLQEDDAYKQALTNSDQRRRDSAGREGGKQLLLGVEAVRYLVWVICCREP